MMDANTTNEPSPGLLMSMALRFDHALGIPGYYDNQNRMFARGASGGEQPTHAMRLASTLVQMHQLWEEVVGQGYYNPDKEGHYAAMCDGVEAVAEADRKRLFGVTQSVITLGVD